MRLLQWQAALRCAALIDTFPTPLACKLGGFQAHSQWSRLEAWPTYRLKLCAVYLVLIIHCLIGPLRGVSGSFTSRAVEKSELVSRCVFSIFAYTQVVTLALCLIRAISSHINEIITPSVEVGIQQSQWRFARERVHGNEQMQQCAWMGPVVGRACNDLACMTDGVLYLYPSRSLIQRRVKPWIEALSERDSHRRAA